MASCDTTVLTGQEGLIQFKPLGTTNCVDDFCPFNGTRIYLGCAAEYDIGDCLNVDVDNIPVGVNFRKHIKRSIRKADIVVVVIGNHWLDSRDEHGDLRLQNPVDFVRLEIETALRLQKHVAPVLVGRAAMPSPSALPETIRELSDLQAAELRVGKCSRMYLASCCASSPTQESGSSSGIVSTISFVSSSTDWSARNGCTSPSATPCPSFP